MCVYKTTAMFTAAQKYKLKLLTFVCGRRYLPSKKQPINFFT